jgi:GTPase
VAFVDEVRINVKAGAGGDGASAFLREPYKPKGGPDGGDGGDGGSVILRADHNIGTLLDLRDHPHIKAARGGHGEGKRRHGSRGEDRVVLVPVGTVVYDDDVLLADLAMPEAEFVAARGGHGGRGNARFATPTRRAPTFAEKGAPGEERWLRLELRLLADVGLVGFPNAGKSTLIARISAARPKIADYPFTTTEPNLGLVRAGEDSFVVADIPGLVPGASQGKGLGHRFLRHIRRAAVLVFMIDLVAYDREPVHDVGTLRAELEAFDPELVTRPSLVVASKIDAGRDRWDDVRAAHPEAIPISAVSGEGIDDLVRQLAEMVKAQRSAAPPAQTYVRHVVRDDPIEVKREDSAWRVRGARAETAVTRTDLDDAEAVERLQKRLISMGVERLLAQAGARTGDEVRIGEVAFNFEPEDEVDETQA